MSHLSSKRSKQTLYKTTFLIILVIGAMFFFFFYGFQILINGSLFINQLANSSKPKITNSKNNILNNIAIDPIPTATNSSSFIFSGSLLGYDELEVYVNQEKVSELSNISDSFSEEISGLKKGSNSIYAIAKSSGSKETKKSEEFNISYQSEKPTIEIESPKDGEKFNKEEIVIKGKTGKETYIHINSLPIVVDADGSFQYTLKLKEGENKIEINATDIVDNQETKNLTVQYIKDE